MGTGVFEDAESLRAALDDFLDERAAGPGDINLLVDAVRLGAVRMLLDTMSGGAEPLPAISEAGSFLARHRGTADLDGSVGGRRVGLRAGSGSDPTYVVSAHCLSPPRRRRSTRATPWRRDSPRPGQEATRGAAPTRQFTPPGGGCPHPGADGPQPGGGSWPPPGGGGQAFPGQGGAVPPPEYLAQQRQPPPPWGPEPPRKKKSRAGLFVALALVLVLLAGGGGLTWYLVGGEDDSKEPDKPEVDPNSIAEVGKRYSSLGADITQGLEKCEATGVEAGQSERLRCSFPTGSLLLITHDGLSGLKANRGKTVNLEVGGRYSRQLPGVFFSQTFEEDSGSRDFVYWDDEAGLQSAKYEADENGADVEVDPLEAKFRSVSASVTLPTTIEDAGLKAFAEQFSLSDCERIPTLAVGELEESYCTTGDIGVWVARFRTLRDLRNSRSSWLDTAKSSDGTVIQFDPLADTGWTVDGDVKGAYASYMDEGDPWLYWDHHTCRCNALGTKTGGTLASLEKWWENS